jgi:spore germination protein (amino acid permease)
MNQKLIQAIHIYTLIIISTGFMVHVLSLPVLLTISKRDAWVSVIFSSIPFLLWILLVFHVYKKLNNEDIMSLLKRNVSFSWIYRFFAILIVFYFFITAFISLKYTLFWAKANYTIEVPNFVVIFLFSIICWYSSAKGIGTISTSALLILPFVTAFGFLIGIGNIPHKNYELLFPIFEHGYKDFFQGIFYASSGFFEITFLFFLTPYLKNKLKMKWLIMVGFILVGLTFGPLVGSIAEFGSVEAAKMRNPAYEQWKLLSISQHVTRLDFLSIFQWLSGAFTRICLSLFIAEKILSNNKKNSWVLPILYFLLIISVCIPLDATSFFFVLRKYFFPISLLFQLVILLLFLLIIHFKGENT